ncbi:MAG TPA: nucleotide exchange factor GrpE [Acidobacteriota bacterium]|nr:nucleotide exchange factor GrpE [Acidobacteriota bacterium]
MHEETADSIPEEVTPAEESPATEAITPSPDPIAQIQTELADARAESEQWRDRFLRKAAEFDNFRKRTDKEKAELAVLAKSTVLTEFLPVADACERALQSLGSPPEGESGLEKYREGVELLYRQVLDALGRLGVVPIEAIGKKFDPHLHEALMREENPNVEENIVLLELRRGYLFKDRLLRPAQVTVSTPPKATNTRKTDL